MMLSKLLRAILGPSSYPLIKGQVYQGQSKGAKAPVVEPKPEKAKPVNPLEN